MSKGASREILAGGFTVERARISRDRQPPGQPPSEGRLPSHPLIELIRRLRLGEGIARDAFLFDKDGAIPGIAIPLRRPLGGRDPGRGGGLAEVPQDPGDQQPNAQGIGGRPA